MSTSPIPDQNQPQPPPPQNPQGLPDVPQSTPTQPQPPAAALQPPQGLPNVPASGNPNPTLAPQPQPVHPVSAMFNKILTQATGGQTTYVDANGQTQKAPQSNMTLGKILTASLLAGIFAKDEYRNAGSAEHPMMVRDYAATGANAVAASSGVINAARQQPQQQSDEQVKAQTQKLMTLQNTANLYRTMSASSAQDHATLQSQIDSNAPLLKDVDEASSLLQESDAPIRFGQHLSKEEAEQQLTGHYLTRTALPDGVESRLNPETGKVEEHPTYTIVDPKAQIKLSPEAAQVAALTNPAFDNLHRTVGGDVTVPLSTAISANHEVMAIHIAQREADDLVAAGLGKQTDLMAAIKKNRQLLPAIDAARDQVAASAGQAPWRVLDAIRGTKNGLLLMDAMGISTQQAEDYISKEHAKAKLAESGGLGDKTPMPNAAEELYKNAQALHLAPAEIANAIGKVPPQGFTVAEYREASNRIQAQANSNRTEANGLRKEQQAELEKTGGPALVAAIGTGRVAPERVSYLLAKKPELMSAVLDAYPDFDSSKASAYSDTYKNFTSGKASVQIHSGGVALRHLRELQALNTTESMVPGTPAYTAYQNKADTLSTELAKFYGDATIPAIAAIRSTLASRLTSNRDAAIRTQAKSMGDKLDEYEQTWANAAPSKAYQAPMPGVSPEARQARAALDPSYKAPGAQRVVPAGATAGRDASGNIIGYKSADGKVVRF